MRIRVHTNGGLNPNLGDLRGSFSHIQSYRTALLDSLLDIRVYIQKGQGMQEKGYCDKENVLKDLCSDERQSTGTSTSQLEDWK